MREEDEWNGFEMYEVSEQLWSANSIIQATKYRRELIGSYMHKIRQYSLLWSKIRPAHDWIGKFCFRLQGDP